MENKGLYEQLQTYAEGDFYPYHMPGHKRRQTGKLPMSLLEIDITEIEGFDNLHQPEGILCELQEHASTLYGAEETFCLINGSTCGVLSAISAVLPEGGHLLMARDSHKSAYHAAYLRNLRLSYIYPEQIRDFGIVEAVTLAQVERALREEPDIGAVFLVSPTYEGRIADVAAIAELVHKRGIPLIVDEAHGAHLGFADGFAAGSCTQGADVVIHSVHKTLPAMTQTALLHVNGKLVDRDRLKRFLHIYQSSSPSYVLMASVGDALEILEKQGRERFAFLREEYRTLLERLGKCRRLSFIPWCEIEEQRQDIGKLAIGTKSAGRSGKWLYDTLRERYHLQCEMAAENYCLAMFTIADGPEAYERMGTALLEIDEELSAGKAPDGGVPVGKIASPDGDVSEEKIASPDGAVLEDEIPSGNETAEGGLFSLREAWDMPWEMTDLSCSAGRIAGDFVNLYPPGVPLLVPGELITEELCGRIRLYLKQGLNVQGVVRQGEKAWLKVLIPDRGDGGECR